MNSVHFRMVLAQKTGLVLLLASLLIVSMASACSPGSALSNTSGTSTPCSTPSTESQGGLCLPNGITPDFPTTTAPSIKTDVTTGALLPSEQPAQLVISGTEQKPSDDLYRLPTSLVSTPVYTPGTCNDDMCSYRGMLFLARPIAPPDNQAIDITYRFGSTQGKKRDPHHGVELLNPFSTSVLAAADGIVRVAGDDKQTLYSLYPNFYGNLVIIEHKLPPGIDSLEATQPLYTLYAHLSEVLVEPGQSINQGQEIGRVGMTGGATGSHLHFEVRLGENTYAASSNPELWLQPLFDPIGQPKGAMAGRVIDSKGTNIPVKQIVLEYLPDGPQDATDREIYLESYEEKALLGRLPWQESFGAGDLSVGWYRVSFPYYGLQSQLFQVFPGQVSVVTIRVD